MPVKPIINNAKKKTSVSTMNSIFKGNRLDKAYFKYTEVKNIQKVAGVVGEKRAEALRKAIKNRNARMRRQTKQLAGEYNVKNALALIRGQYLPPMVRVDFSKVKSVKDYNTLMRMLEADKTPKWKGERLDKMREWLAKSVRRSIWIDDEDDPELFNRIYSMSEREIMQFRRDYKGLIGDIFDYYVDDQAIDSDDRDIMWARIRRAVGLTGEIGATPIYAV